MTFKTLLFTFTLVAGFTAQAAVKNLCDDMIASGKSSDEQIRKCLAKMGESTTYKENQQKKKWQADADSAKSAEDAAKKANVESKKFSLSDLDDAGFGKPFFAMRVDYSNVRKPKEKRITEGDALCKYLGYDKALKSIVSAEIMPGEANQNGLVVDTNFLGSISKEPDLYVDKDEKYTVRKYVEITCARVKSKDVAGTADELSKVAEDLIVLNETFNGPKTKDKSSGVNDGPRKPAGDGKTDMGYKRPDWATQVPAQQNIEK
jgi:polyhydroxyalkanoate synthesis regulator phasin